ncbi:MAG TPA: maleylpyruvate isomerase family mycothiol-dependent enzyme [Acidimicrobiales bacterium]|nr:maleylpyruvate isomerase family mycothiol-dependent enzyme [Acidimicrobiales bacterium]
METASHIRALERDGRLLVKAAREAGLDAPVPSCPGWNVRDLLAHIGFVHRWAATYVSTAREEMLEEADEDTVLASAPPADALLEWVEAGHLALVRSLEETPGDVRCWTFLPAPSPLAFWARRQAHETAVHRVDAELAAGGPRSAIDAEMGADGVDELLMGFLGRSAAQKAHETVVGSMAILPTDRPERWTARVLAEHADAEQGAAECDTTLSAPAADLYLLLWNRRSAEGLDITGRRELLDLWRQRVGVTWA